MVYVNHTRCMHAGPQQLESPGRECMGPNDPAASTARSIGECHTALMHRDVVLVHELLVLPVWPADLPTRSLLVVYNKLHVTVTTAATTNVQT